MLNSKYPVSRYFFIILLALIFIPTSDVHAQDITIGETAILTNPDNGNGNLLVSQSTTLSQTATIQSLSFYVTTAAGNLRLGIYDSTGPSGGPGAKRAETNSFTPVVGWNTASVITPVSLTTGTYWLAYLPSDNNLAFVKTQDGSSSGKYYSFTYGALPATFSTSPNTTASHWSFYATLSTGPDTTPPILSNGSPSGSIPATTSTTISLSTNENATCKYATTAGTSYAFMPNTFTTTGGTSHSAMVTGLSSGNSYSYYVRCQDTAPTPNVNTADYAISFSVAVPDTQAPTAPTNLTATAQSSSQINLSWTASTDNVGVAGYRVERCQGSTCTTFAQIGIPTGTSYNDTGLAANTTYRYQVRATDAAGNLSGYSSIGSATTQASGGGGADADFQARCTGSGVFLCEGFETNASVLTYANPDWRGIVTAARDNAVYTSGSGSMRIQCPGNSEDNCGGNWDRKNWGQNFGQNSTFYVQFRQRFSPEMLNGILEDGLGQGFKQVVLADSGGQLCANVEVTTQNSYFAGYPIMYDRCGYQFAKVISPSPNYDSLLQWSSFYPSRPPGTIECHSYNPPANPTDCQYYAENNWMTFYYVIHIGTWGQANSYVKAYVATEGQPMRQFINMDPWTAQNDGAGSVYNRIWLGNYITRKDSSHAHATAYTWYDEVIVSTQPIVAPGTATPSPDTTPPIVSITAPSNGSTVSGSSVTISANASDNIGVSGVQFLFDGANLNNEDTTSPYSITWNTTTATNGLHTLTARTRDAAGNTTTSNSVTITVDNGPLGGDRNQDRAVNGADWTIMANVWFTADATADINADGIVNSIDFSLMNANWGRTI